MATAIDTHFGPWSEEDLVGLPESMPRCELLEGTLLVNPPAAVPHQAVSRRLANLLELACTAELIVVEAVGVRLPDNTVFIPDVLVVARDVGLADSSGILDSAAVALAVEIVSPGSRTADRFTKPAVYARAGIPSFWRVELEDDPGVFAYRLEQGRYVVAGTARPGERLVVSKPFPVSIDPAHLRP
jgi:Uma2 family endonuclease